MISPVVSDLAEKERIAKYLDRREYVRPVLVTSRGDGRSLYIVGSKDLFIYDEDKRTGFLPVNGFQFPVEAILRVFETPDRTDLDINFRAVRRMR